jgi:large subunit ribosomal protein L18
MKNKGKVRLEGRTRRHMRIRRKVHGTAERPRLTVYRSAKYIYAQLVDDLSGRTLMTVSSRDQAIQSELKSAKGKIVAGKAVGKRIAEMAKERGIERVCFDRGGYLYHGRVKAIADGAREGGLNF